jgi:hypothetical protein
MPKNSINDIVAPRSTKKYLNELPKVHREHADKKPQTDLPPPPVYYESNTSNGSRLWIWIVAVICALVTFFAVSTLFSGAKVSITPRTDTIVFDATAFTATKDSVEGALPFETMEIEGEESIAIPSTAHGVIETRATGKVVLYNEHSTTSQPLTIETRLETKDGKIYKTDERVVIPGYKMVNGEKIPGMIEIGVHADLPGSSYNIPLSDFVIFGFKGTTKSSTIYARAKTEMTGGNSGLLYSVSGTEGETARNDAVKKLTEKLIREARAQIPVEYILYDGAVHIAINNSPMEYTSSEKDVPITARGILRGVIFKRDALADAIVQKKDSASIPGTISIANLDELVFKSGTVTSGILEEISTLDFTLSGEAKMVWKYNPEEIIAELIGKHKKEMKTVFNGMKNIDKARVSMSPFWNSKFPEEATKIKILEE